MNEPSDMSDASTRPQDYAGLRAELAELASDFTPVITELWPRLEDHKYRWELHSYGLPEGYDRQVAADVIALLAEALKGIGIADNKLIARRRRRHHGQATHSSAVVTAVRTGITSLADALVSASVMLTAAIICAGAAGADPSQQDQFVALLEQEQIPPVDDGEVASVVARAHQICGELNGSTPVDTLVNDEMNRGYEDNPRLHLYPDRVRRTAVRLITASVDVYCPRHQGELPPYE